MVFASIFPILSTINPRLGSQLSRGYKGSYHPYSPRPSSASVFEHVKTYYSLVASQPNDLILVRSRDDIRECIETKRKKNNKKRTGFLMALEGAEALEDTNDIQILYNLGLRSLGFTWNYDTRYSASCMSKKDYGLTGEGQALLEQMNELGLIIDLSHASKRAVMDIFQSSKLPMLVSHANAKAVFDCARNLDDQVLDALKTNHGVVGFVFAREMIGGRSDIKELVRHIIYVYENYGPDLPAIGTDYFGLGDNEAPRGLEDITKMGEIWRLLLESGFKEIDIEKIANKNALRVIEANASKWRPHC
jgi:membrane dipeptidase